ncbi:hypothetical protein GTA09_19885 [Rhodococcus hoagii]|nr:hypothetical protein [Prescottella equi]
MVDTDREQRKITIGSATVIDGDSEKVIGALQTTLNDRYTYMQMNKSEATETLFEVAGVRSTAPITFRPEPYACTPMGASPATWSGTKCSKRGVEQGRPRSHGACAQLLKEVNNWQGRAERDLTEMTSRLAALREEPTLEFTKGPELRQLEHDLGEMKADINAARNSPEALRRFAEESDRRGRMGQYGGWTLDLNPTVGHADDRGMTRDDLKDSVPERMQAHAERWTEEQAARAEARQADPWLPRSSDGSVTTWRRSGERPTRCPRSVDGPKWHWTAWDGQGKHRNRTERAAQYRTVHGPVQGRRLRQGTEISSDYLLHRKPLPEIDESRHEEAPTAPDEQQQSRPNRRTRRTGESETGCRQAGVGGSSGSADTSERRPPARG